MAEDREILKEIWSGQIPVQFTLSSIEVVTMQEPDPYYLMVPRIAYFPIVMDKVIKFFSQYITEMKHSGPDLWLEFEGQPLKWNYPIGLLYDIHSKDITLPWNITVHFENFPEDEIIKYNNRALIESLFMSTVKEADFLKHRSQVVNSMQKKEHNQLWLGLQNDKFDQFWAANKKLMDLNNEEGFKYIPIRIYQPDTPSIQALIKPINENGQVATLGEVINKIILENIDVNLSTTDFKTIIHGIEPPLETPIQWLSEHLSYPDNFLHFTLLKNEFY